MNLSNMAEDTSVIKWNLFRPNKHRVALAVGTIITNDQAV